MRRILAWVVACMALTGCDAHGHGGSRGSSFPFEAAATVAAATAVEVANALTQPDPASLADPVYVPGPPDPPAFTPADPSSVAFDPVPVLNAIDALDLSMCTRYGALIGWGRARLTFEPDGTASTVVVESTAGLSQTAIECLRSELSGVSAAPFAGAAITIGASYFVR